VKSKFFGMFVTILIILLLGAGGYIAFLLMDDSDQGGEPTVDEILDATWETEEITTNLANNDIIRIQFSVQLDNKKAREEIEKRDFQVYNAIINELSSMESSHFREKDSLQSLEEQLTAKIDELLHNGKVVRVYTTQKIIQ